MPERYTRSLRRIPPELVVGKIRIARTGKDDLTVDIFDPQGNIVYALPEMEVHAGESLTLSMPSQEVVGEICEAYRPGSES